jgi:carboxyl-terminal processing protease
MYILDLILFLGVIITIVSILLLKFFSKENKYTDLIKFFPIMLSGIHFIIGKFNYMVVPVYIASIIIIFTYTNKKSKIVYTVICLLTVTLSLIPLGIIGGFKLNDYASMSYSDAFMNLNQKLRANYPFTDWKRIDFNKKYDEYIEKFKSADKNNDKEAYYLALKEYVISFNDGHISVINPLELQPLGINDNLVSNLSKKYRGSGYGFSLIKLDDGNVVVSIIDENSDAYKAGIRVGTILTKWNYKPMKEAVGEVSILWSLARSTDKFDMEQNNYMMLSRAIEGESAKIVFINELNEEQVLTLKAEKNNYNIGSKDRDIFYHKEKNSKDIEYKLLNKGHGYIRLSTMQPENEEEVFEQFKNALNEFKENSAKDLIIDLRNNGGGRDEFGAKILGLFSNKEIFYLQENLYDSRTNSFVKQKDILSKPNYLGFDKKIVVLANSGSVSAAEGLVYNLKKLGNVISAGITGTNGSFGTVTDGEILMPENYMVVYPKIACLDESGNIMIDSDYTGIGGVKPDLKIPFNMESIKEMYVKGNDYEIDYLLNYLDNNQVLK